MKIKSILLLLAVAGSQFGYAVSKGDQVRISETLLGTVTSVSNGGNPKVEVFQDPDNRPKGIVKVPYMVTIDDVNYVVEDIAAKGFSHNQDITGIELPNSLKNIYMQSFYGCTSLSQVTFPNGNSVEWIGESAFGHTYALKSISLPAVEGIYNFAFSRSNIEEITLPAIKSIGAGAFQECQELKYVYAGPNLKTIGNIAFCNCPKLEGVSLQAALTEIGSSAFAYSPMLREIVIPRNVTSIGKDAFRGVGTKRIFILSWDTPKFLEESQLLHGSLIEEVYVHEHILDEVKEFLATAGPTSEGVTPTKAEVKPLDDVVHVENIEAEETEFRLEPMFEGISDIKVYTSAGGERVLPYDDVYHLGSAVNALLEYRIDNVNYLSYFIFNLGLSEVKTIESDNLSVENKTYDLMGREIRTPQPGTVYIRGGRKFIAR